MGQSSTMVDRRPGSISRRALPPRASLTRAAMARSSPLRSAATPLRRSKTVARSSAETTVGGGAAVDDHLDDPPVRHARGPDPDRPVAGRSDRVRHRMLQGQPRLLLGERDLDGGPVGDLQADRVGLDPGPGLAIFDEVGQEAARVELEGGGGLGVGLGLDQPAVVRQLGEHLLHLPGVLVEEGQVFLELRVRVRVGLADRPDGQADDVQGGPEVVHHQGQEVRIDRRGGRGGSGFRQPSGAWARVPDRPSRPRSNHRTLRPGRANEEAGDDRQARDAEVSRLADARSGPGRSVESDRTTTASPDLAFRSESRKVRGSDWDELEAPSRSRRATTRGAIVPSPSKMSGSSGVTGKTSRHRETASGASRLGPAKRGDSSIRPRRPIAVFGVRSRA